MGIYEDGKIVMAGQNKAQLHYSGSPDNLNIFEDAFGRIDEVFEMCYEDSKKYWISSTDHEGNCMLFAQVYSANLEELDRQLVQKETESIARQIADLEKERENIANGVLYDLTDNINACLNKEIKKYTQWLVSSEKELSELKEDTDSYNKKSATIENYKEKIAKLEAKKIIPAEA